jgi:hypothetical protein
MSEFHGLTQFAEDLLSAGRPEFRLTPDQILQLRLHVKMIASWAERIPQETSFVFVSWQEVLVLPRIEGYSREELATAVYLQPLHSQLCAIALQVLWKANQLIRCLATTLDTADLIVAATMARSLVETAAAFGVESDQISILWRERCRRPAPDLESLQDFVEDTRRVVGQILFGTKMKRDDTPETGIARTNIMTLIVKAEKLSDNPGLRTLYERLCDTVHPSIGSNRCFWTKEPAADERGPVFSFSAKRTAKGELSDLPATIGLSALWALQWLGWMWNIFDRTRKDLCLTAKIYALPVSYYGVLRPGSAGEYCPCGSTSLSDVCPHHFGRSEGTPNVTTLPTQS